MRNRAGGLGLVLVAFALAGCVGETAPEESEDSSTPVGPYELDLAAENCDGSAMIVLVPPDRVEPYLAPGFYARDAQDLFIGLPVASGQIPLFIATISCTTSAAAVPEPHQFGFVGILVDPPSVDGFEPGVGYDVLGVVAVAPLQLAKALAPSGWDVQAGNITSSATSLANGGAFVRVGAAVDMIPAYSYTMLLPSPVPKDTPLVGFNAFSVRVWTDSARGASVLSYVFSGDVPVGMGACTLPAGSVVHNLTGSTNCFPSTQLSPKANIAAAGLGVRVDARFRHFAGAHAR